MCDLFKGVSCYFRRVLDLIVLMATQNVRTQERTGGPIAVKQAELFLSFTQLFEYGWTKTAVAEDYPIEFAYSFMH